MSPAQSGVFDEIPVLDISLIRDTGTRSDLLRQLRDALTRVGFMYIVGHDVPVQAIADVVNALPELFSLPAEKKEEVALRKSPHFLGYSGDGSETTAGNSDRREQFEFATELPCSWTEGQPLAERLRGPNQWPSSLPHLRPIVETYIQHLTTLATQFLYLVSEALGLDSDALEPFVSNQHRLKLVHYPAVFGREAVLGVGPHKDSSGWLTFLLQASADVVGLQAMNREGKWIDIPPKAGSFVVNIGQALEIVTLGACPATIHRVLNSDRERFSVPFFQGVRLSLTKKEATDTLRSHFEVQAQNDSGRRNPLQLASPFLEGINDTWGDSQLHIKVRSHEDVGRRFYPSLLEK